MDNRVRTSARKASWICCGCCLADPAQPGRRCSGAPSLCGGDSPQGFPLEASEVRSATGAKVSTPGAAKRKVRRPRRDDAPKAARRDQLAAGAVIDLLHAPPNIVMNRINRRRPDGGCRE